MGKAAGSGKSGSHPYSRKNNSLTVLQPGWAGVFVSCPRGKESQCRNEIMQIAETYIETHYPELLKQPEDSEDVEDEDIEASLQRELSEMKAAKPSQVITAHIIGIECVIFLRLKAPLAPVKFVTDICKDVASTGVSHCRYVQRLSPASLLVHADLEQLPKFEALVKPEFETPGLKFAIRPTTRNTKLTRDELIPEVAKLVGPGHSVDLKNYDKLLIVECFKSVIGLAIVDNSFEQLSRFNLSQIVQKCIEKATAAKTPESAVAVAEAEAQCADSDK